MRFQGKFTELGVLKPTQMSRFQDDSGDHSFVHTREATRRPPRQEFQPRPRPMGFVLLLPSLSPSVSS